MFQTVFDIAWIASDVSRHTRYNAPSEFIDLVAGGNRGFCDQPHLFYCAALIEITPGREYTMRIAPSSAVCIHAVMTSSTNGVSTQTSWATRVRDQALREQVVRLCASPNDPDVLDTTPHHGLCTTFVRIYFMERPAYGRTPIIEMTRKGESSHRLVPASVAALWKFLPIRELTVIRKYCAVLIGAMRPYNVWTLNNVDHRRGFRARIKEFLVNQRGRYFTLELSLRRGEVLEILYERQPHTWASLAFVTKETQTVNYVNLTEILPETDGRVRLRVGPGDRNEPGWYSTRGRRTGSRFPSTEGT
jgi:hypothetical protein